VSSKALVFESVEEPKKSMSIELLKLLSSLVALALLGFFWSTAHVSLRLAKAFVREVEEFCQGHSVNIRKLTVYISKTCVFLTNEGR